MCILKLDEINTCKEMVFMSKELSDILKIKLNKLGIGTWKAQLGNLLEAMCGNATVEHDYARGHADAGIVEAELPASSTVVLHFSNSDAAANFLIPDDVYKTYVVINGTNYNVTLKAGSKGQVIPKGLLTVVYAKDGFQVIGDSVTLDGLQTFTNKTLSAPIINNPVITGAKYDQDTFVVHAFEGDDVVWNVTYDELKNSAFIVGSATGAVTVTLPARPTANKTLPIINMSGQAVTVKGPGEDVGVTIVATKNAILYYFQNVVVRLTPDA
jgi:hypothetical protein